MNTDLEQTLGSLAGLLALLALSLMTVLLLKRRRQLAELHSHLRTMTQQEAQLSAALAQVAVAPAASDASPPAQPSTAANLTTNTDT